MIPFSAINMTMFGNGTPTEIVIQCSKISAVPSIGLFLVLLVLAGFFIGIFAFSNKKQFFVFFALPIIAIAVFLWFIIAHLPMSSIHITDWFSSLFG